MVSAVSRCHLVDTFKSTQGPSSLFSQPALNSHSHKAVLIHLRTPTFQGTPPSLTINYHHKSIGGKEFSEIASQILLTHSMS
jgi:hypothetical protein